MNCPQSPPIPQSLIKANSLDIDVAALISSVCLIAGYYGNYVDYKKIFDIENQFLIGSDMFKYIMYFEKILDSIRTLLRSNDVSKETKLKIVCEFEDMLSEIKNGSDNIPDKVYNRITPKYGLETRENYNSKRLKTICDEVKRIKELL